MAQASRRGLVSVGATGAAGRADAATTRAARRHARQRACTVLVVAALALGGYTVLHAPRFLVHRLDIRGLVQLTPAQVTRTVDLPAGTYLWQVRPWNVDARLDRLPLVRSAAAALIWPDVLRITLVERQPVALLAYRAGLGVEIDRAGRALEVVPLPPTAGDGALVASTTVGAASAGAAASAAVPASASAAAASGAANIAAASGAAASAAASGAAPSPASAPAEILSSLPLVTGLRLPAAVKPGRLLSLPGVQTAVEVALGLGVGGRAAVTAIHLSSDGQVTLSTRAGIRVLLGDGSDARAKTEVLLGLLQDVGRRGLHVAEIDLSSADTPSIRMQAAQPVVAASRVSAGRPAAAPVRPAPRPPVATKPHSSPTGRNLLPR